MVENVPGLDALLTRCTGLQSLLLRHLMPIPNASLDLLVDRCSGLRQLNLSSVGNLMDQHLVTMAVRMAHLEKLDVSWNPSECLDGEGLGSGGGVWVGMVRGGWGVGVGEMGWEGENRGSHLVE